MYDPDRIFGPFSTRQVLVFGIGYSIFYLVDRFLTGDMLYLKVAVVVICAAIAYRLRPHKVEGDPIEYLRKKYPSNKSFIKAIIHKRAEVMSQITMRKEKGQTPDTSLEELFRKLENADPKSVGVNHFK